MRLVACEMCGKVVKKYPSQISKHVYCSPNCFYEALRRGYYAKRTRVTMTCEVCGKKFEVLPSAVKYRKTCSYTCTGKRRAILWREKYWVTTKCEICGKEIHHHRRLSRRFCSRKCAGKWLTIYFAQKRKMTFDHFKKQKNRRRVWRKTLKKLSGIECELCGWKEAPIDICHIVPVRDGGKTVLDNVVFLCPNHHRMYDNGLIQREHLVALVQKRQRDTTPAFQQLP